MLLPPLPDSFCFVANASAATGAATVRLLAREGSRVVTLDRNPTALKAVDGPTVFGYKVNLELISEVRAFNRLMTEFFGQSEGFSHYFLTFTHESGCADDPVGWRHRIDLLLERMHPKEPGPSVVVMLMDTPNNRGLATLVGEQVKVRSDLLDRPIRFHQLWARQMDQPTLRALPIDVRMARAAVVSTRLFVDHDQELFFAL